MRLHLPGWSSPLEALWACQTWGVWNLTQPPPLLASDPGKGRSTSSLGLWGQAWSLVPPPPSPAPAGLGCSVCCGHFPGPQPLTSSCQCPPAFHSCSVTLSNTLLCVCHPAYITSCCCPFGVSVPLVLAFPCPRRLPKTSATLCPRPEVLGNQGSPRTFGQ